LLPLFSSIDKHPQSGSLLPHSKESPVPYGIEEIMTHRKILRFEIASKISRLGAAIGMVAMLAASISGAMEIPTAAPEKEGFSVERLARLDAKTHSYVDEGRTSGIITLIARHGRIVHFDVYGKADIEAGTAIRANSLFRMYQALLE